MIAVVVSENPNACGEGYADEPKHVRVKYVVALAMFVSVFALNKALLIFQRSSSSLWSSRRL